MSNIKKYFYLPVVFLAFSFLLWNIISNLSLLSTLKWQFNFLYLFLAFGCAFSVYTLNAFSWFVVLKFLDINISIYQAIRVWVLSNLSRLLPGSVWQYVSRVYLSEQVGISKVDSTIALIVEIIANILIGIVVIYFVAFFWELPSQINEIKNFLLVILIVGFISLLLFFRIFLSIIKKVLNFLFKINLVRHQIKYNFKYLPFLIVGFIFQFVLAGLSIYFLINSFFSIEFSEYPIIVGSYAFSWLVGYLTIISPGGLGVQEVTLSSLLSFLVPLPIASLIAIFFRLMLFIAEFSVLSLIFAILRFKGKNMSLPKIL